MLFVTLGTLGFALVAYLAYRRYQRKANASWLAAARKARLREKLQFSMYKEDTA